MRPAFCIATRFWGLSKRDVKRLTTWLDAACAIVPAESVFVAIRSEADRSGSQEFLRKEYPGVTAFPVTPWGRVVQAPNALLLKCAERRMRHVLFTSTEYPPAPALVSRLVSHADAKTLVVGARLPTHDFKESARGDSLVRNANGLQIPWNTYALWSLEHLVHTGFVLTADAFHDPDNAGMEEMGTIAAQQALWPGNAVAKLVTPGEQELAVNVHGWTIKRRERYIRNLRSKEARAAAQLRRLGLKPPAVHHIRDGRKKQR